MKADWMDSASAPLQEPSGRPDRSFNGSGFHTLDPTGVGLSVLVQGRALCLDPQNRLLVTGQVARLFAYPYDYDVLVSRILESGADDLAFGVNGSTILEPFGNSDDLALDRPFAITFDPLTNRIFGAGRTYSAGLGGYKIWDGFVFRVKP